MLVSVYCDELIMRISIRGIDSVKVGRLIHKTVPFRRRKLVTAEGFRSAGNEQELLEETSDGDVDVEGETAVQQAWTELADIEREQERWSELRTHIEQKLEMCRQRGVALEDV